MRRIAPLLLSLAMALESAAFPAEGFEPENLVLYQVDEVLRQRVPSVNDLGSYYKKIVAECQSFLAKSTTPANLVVVLAAKPGGQCRFWFIPNGAQNKELNLPGLQKRLEAIPALEVYGGPFAMAIRGKIAGGLPASKEEANAGMPIPQEWKDAIKDTKERVVVPEGILAIVWPDPPGTVVEKLPSTPTEYVTQILEPLGGKIQKPKDWFYSQSQKGPAYTWTLSREDSSKGHYTTGVRIQAFIGVKEATGQSPKDFILDFIKSKQTSPDVHVLETCEEKNQGMFTRMCLQTEEGPHHILYSVFWGNDLDMAVVTIAGTSKQLWRIYAPTFDKMNTFELIDMKRFAEEKESGPKK